MRRIAPVLAIAALAIASLSACAPAETGKDVSCSQYRSGAASSTVSAPGKVGAKPKIDFPTPLRSKKVQVSAISRGSGATIQSGDTAGFSFTLSIGRTGQVLQSDGYDGSKGFFFWTKSENSAIATALTCQTVGSRIAVTGPIGKLLGAGAGAQSGIDDAETLVMVIDIQHRYLGKADGVNQLQVPGLPAVVTAADGQPGIVLPGDGAPKEKTTAIVKAGGGATVHKGQQVLVHFTSWQWGDTASVSQSTWKNGNPVSVEAGESSDSAQFPPAPQLVGKKVGSQLIQVVPADGSGGADAAPTVYVIDILGVVS